MVATLSRRDFLGFSAAGAAGLLVPDLAVSTRRVFRIGHPIPEIKKELWLQEWTNPDGTRGFREVYLSSKVEFLDLPTVGKSVNTFTSYRADPPRIHGIPHALVRPISFKVSVGADSNGRVAQVTYPAWQSRAGG